MYDIQKPKGPTKRSSPTAGGANPRMMPVLGVVKSNIDSTRTGSIWVYLTDNSGLDPDDRANWRQVRFLSPFFGYTRSDAPNQGYGSFKGNPSSYGMWMTQPDIGTTVLCLFVDGDLNYGFYIGCVPEPDAMQMIPAIGATDNIVPNSGEATSFGGALKLPVTNINTNNKATSNSPEYLTAAKPVHSYSAAIMFQQGILRDPIRGPISSSSQRETPSRVGWGVSTPGRPIYDGGFDDTSIAKNLTPEKEKELRIVSRRGGHTIVMDDGDIVGKDQLVRIRTALGHQILMSDDGQTLMILHSNGQSYIELGKEGTVDIFSTNSINLRTQGDLNLHADNNVNIHATKNLNIQGENIHINSEKEFKHRVGTDHSVFTGGKYGHKVSQGMSFKSGGAASFAAGGAAYINGSKVNLNTGSGSSPGDVAPIDKVLHTDTLFDKTKGFLAAPAKLTSITSRAPAHAPWANAGQGVNVKTDITADGQLPAAPKQNVQQTNDIANSNLSNPVPQAVVASAPQIPAAGGAIDTKTTQALAATAAADAKSGTFSEAVTKGTAIVQTANGVQAAAGAAIPLTAQQMEQAGQIKPGSSVLVNSIAASTGNAKQAFSSTVFTTGNLNSYVSSSTTQATALSTNLQVAQTGLQNAGAITGKETSTQVSGLIYSAAQNGLGSTLDTVKSSATNVGTDTLKGVQDSGALKDIAKGNFAAGLSTGTKGALSGLTNSVKSLGSSVVDAASKARGAAAGAFAAISNAIKPMKAGVPQNLTEIAKKSAEETAAKGAEAATNPLSQAASSAAGNSALGSTAGKAAGAATDAVSVAAASLTAGVRSSASTLASGVNALPGGASAVSAVTNLSNGTIPTLPNTDNLKDAMTGLSTNTLNNANVSIPTTSLSGTTANAASGLLKQLQNSPLTSVLTKGLPAGASAQLQNAINSIASSGSGLKAPEVATGTTDRSSVASATTSQLGDPKIPAPNFSATPVSTEDFDARLAKSKEVSKLRNEWQTKLKEYNKAVKTYNTEFDKAHEAFKKKKIAAGLDPEQPTPEGHPLYAESRALTQELTTKSDNLKVQERGVDEAFNKYQDYFNNVFKPSSSQQTPSLGGIISDIILK